MGLEQTSVEYRHAGRPTMNTIAYTIHNCPVCDVLISLIFSHEFPIRKLSHSKVLTCDLRGAHTHTHTHTHTQSPYVHVSSVNF